MPAEGEGDGGDPSTIWAHPRTLARFERTHRIATGDGSWSWSTWVFVALLVAISIPYCTR